MQRNEKVRICAIEEFDARSPRARHINTRDERRTTSSARPTPAAGGKPTSRPAFLGPGCTHDRATQALPEPVSEDSTEAEVATPPEKTAKKSAAKRTTKKRR